MQKIILTGSIAYDHVMKFEGRFSDFILPNQLHNLSVSFRIDKKETHFGGCAGNIAYNLALLEENPLIIAVAGNDFQRYQLWLQKNHIDSGEIVQVRDQETASASILTDQTGNQIATFFAGASSENVAPFLENYKDTDPLVLIGPDNIQRMVHFINECQRLQIPYLFDPGQQLPQFSKEELQDAINAAKGVLVNEYELHLLMEKSGYTVKDIMKHVEFLITTLGEKGSLIETNAAKYEIPIAPPQKIIDPTGCGDAYRAGIIKGLKQDYNWEKTGRIAALMATYAIEHNGSQNHHFTMPKFWKRYEETFS